MRRFMYPKPGWIALHIVAVILLFLLGFTVHF